MILSFLPHRDFTYINPKLKFYGVMLLVVHGFAHILPKEVNVSFDTP